MRLVNGHMLSMMALAFLLALGLGDASAQTNPAPFVNQPLVPTAVAPGSAGFTLTANGGGFISTSLVSWTVGKTITPLSTQFVSSTQLTATVPSSLVASAGTATVTVTNPGGATSSGQSFQVSTPASAVVLGKVAYPALNFPGPLAPGDFNNDGKLDFVQCDNNGNDVLLFVGNGDGTFQPSVRVTVGPTFTRCSGVVTADMNGDGNLDLVVSNQASPGDVSVALGNGDGTFRAPTSYAAGVFPASLAVGDFNGDGKLDVALVNSCGSDPTCNSDGSISVYLGNGDGTLQLPTMFVTAFAPRAVTVADFRGNGVLDVAAATADGASILLGNGDGSFQPHVEYNAGAANSNGISVADFNGDGKLDIAALNATGVSLLLGNGDGTFQAPAFFPTTNPVSGIAVGDFNSDGKLDIVTSGFGISTLLGNGDGTFAPAVREYQRIGFSFLTIGDFNQDGKLDAISGASSLVYSLLQTTLEIAPVSAGFGPQAIDITSAPRNVTLTNLGASPISITSITIGGGRGAFAQTNNCGSSLAAGATCTIAVTFMPVSVVSYGARITINDNAVGNPHTVPLSGQGAQSCCITLSPTALQFGNQKVGTTSAPQTVTVTNAGGYTVVVQKLSVAGKNPGDFAQTNTCPANLVVAASCTISVTFTPTTTGARGASVDITDTAAGGRQFISVHGTGTN